MIIQTASVMRPRAHLASRLPEPERRESPEPVDLREAARRLLTPPEPAREATPPEVLWELEGVRSLPWIGEDGRLVHGAAAPGLSPFEGVLQGRSPGRRVEWSVQTSGKCQDQPVKLGDKLLVPVRDPHGLVAVDPSTGEEAWRARNALAPIEQDSAGRVFARGYHPSVIRLSPGGGRMWTTEVDGQVVRTFAESGGVLVAGCLASHTTRAGTARGFDPESGRPLWTVETWDAELAADESRVFIAGDGGNHLKVLDAATGEVEKVLDFGGRYRKLRPQAVGPDGTLYASHFSGMNSELLAIGPERGRVRWTASVDGGVGRLLFDGRGQLFMSARGWSGGSSVSCLETAGGKTLWKGRMAGRDPKVGLGADGTLYALTEFGTLRAMRAPAPEEPAPDAPPVVFDFDDLVVVGDFAVEKREE